MKLNIEQGSQEWHNLRKSCIGATDFAVIAANNKLCKNIYNISLKRLVRDKLNPKPHKPNKYMDMGHKFEKQLLDSANCIEYGGVYRHKTLSHIIASLDGLRHDNGKCVILEAKTTTKTFDRLYEAIEYWKYQITHQIYTLGVTSAELVVGVSLKPEHDQLLYIHKETITPVINYEDWLILTQDFYIKYLKEMKV